jgi:hypothetical protein
LEKTLIAPADEVQIPSSSLTAMLQLTKRPRGVVTLTDVVRTPDLQSLATALSRDQLATLCVGLLGDAEAQDRLNWFDLPLLLRRLAHAAVWTQRRHPAWGFGLLGVGTTAASALVFASQSPYVRAVVSLNGRPDLAGYALGSVRAPTLLLVGSRDAQLHACNASALDDCAAERRCTWCRRPPQSRTQTSSLRMLRP